MTSRVVASLLIVFACAGVQAEDAYSWLQKMNQASRSLSLSGVFVYQTQGRSETSRIYRLVDGTGEHERLETLDGTPREVVRHNENVQCFLPADKILVLDRVIQARQPGRLISKPAALEEIYSVQLGEHARVADREAQIVNLVPRDDMRYGHQLWIDVATGLLLKSRMTGNASGMLEQFAFTEVHPGALIDRDLIKAKSSRTEGWRVISAAGEDIRPEDSVWAFRQLPPGFKQIALLKRVMRKSEAAAVHAAFSDGFANVSVFVEPSVAKAAQNPAPGSGPVGMYRRMLGEYQVTVLGEVPKAALKRFAEGVERRK